MLEDKDHDFSNYSETQAHSLENHGFYGFYWFLRCFVSMGSKNIGKTNVFSEGRGSKTWVKPMFWRGHLQKTSVKPMFLEPLLRKHRKNR